MQRAKLSGGIAALSLAKNLSLAKPVLARLMSLMMVETPPVNAPPANRTASVTIHSVLDLSAIVLVG